MKALRPMGPRGYLAAALNGSRGVDRGTMSRGSSAPHIAPGSTRASGETPPASGSRGRTDNGPLVPEAEEETTAGRRFQVSDPKTKKFRNILGSINGAPGATAGSLRRDSGAPAAHPWPRSVPLPGGGDQ